MSDTHASVPAQVAPGQQCWPSLPQRRHMPVTHAKPAWQMSPAQQVLPVGAARRRGGGAHAARACRALAALGARLAASARALTAPPRHAVGAVAAVRGAHARRARERAARALAALASALARGAAAAALARLSAALHRRVRVRRGLVEGDVVDVAEVVDEGHVEAGGSVVALCARAEGDDRSERDAQKSRRSHGEHRDSCASEVASQRGDGSSGAAPQTSRAKWGSRDHPGRCTGGPHAVRVTPRCDGR